MSLYQRRYQCEWTLSSQDTKLGALAARYCESTEAYDRTVCTGPIIDGAIYPATARERALIARFAQREREQVLVEALEAGFNKTELNKAIAKHDRRHPGA